MKSLVFKTAWQLKNNFKSFSDALAYAWKVVKLKLAMLSKVVEFKYQKVDGSIRTAIGTLSSKFVDYEYKGQTSSNKVFTYYDVEQGGFRSCKIENIIF
ncbi:SH3 beta-barrel fold-containing protein [Sphingobacterium multivorum]|uniref:SH3 beta-barrel fold-containing protein n=1 Tax=Sphingobacterium multivorum TaxID=28454 RepID=UPI003DA22DFB